MTSEDNHNEPCHTVSVSLSCIYISCVCCVLYTVSQKGTSILLPITLANINRFSIFFSLMNSAINVQQSIYYIGHHTLTACVAALPCEIKIANFVILQAQ